jgi:mono/diheme cytochrome c family protein
MCRPRTVALLILLSACSEHGSSQSPTMHDAGDAGFELDASLLPDASNSTGPEVTDLAARPAFCAHPGDDAVHDAFCKGPVRELRSLRDLQQLLELRPAEDPPEPIPITPGQLDPQYLLSSVAVLGHSTALSGHLVSTLNPRVIVMGTETFLTFTRGEQRVELISRMRFKDSAEFYLLSFEQACNATADGCTPGDLYTSRVESDWSRVELRDGAELTNTPTDCKVCHQRGSDQPRLLMRELESPWTHFFYPANITPPEAPGVTGSHLMEDYLAAKGGEPYAGFPLHAISAATPFFMQSLVGPDQLLLFDAPTIEDERYPYGPDGYAEEPQQSATWEAAYEAFKRGEQLALPYFAARVTDPDKQAALTDAYQRYAAGELSADALPDLADIYPDDPHERALRGLQTEPDATPADALIQACASCHSDALDQTISRARFNVSVSRMERSELDAAIERIELPYGAEGAMPPREVRQLDPSARERLIEYLRKDPAELDADGSLETASQLGMTGGRALRSMSVDGL